MSWREETTEIWLKFKSHINQMSMFVFILISLYGVSSYVSMFSVFVELPVFVNALPEGWNLPTHLIFFVQLSSLGPALYVVLKKCFPDKIEDWLTSIVLLVLGIVCCPLLAIFWDTTVGIGGGQYSVPLYILASLNALMDSTAPVVFLPYMAPFRPMFITALYFGKFIGGLFTGSVGLLQGVGELPYCANTTYYSYFNHSWITEFTEVYPPPSLSVSSFYWIMESILILSMIAFALLHFHPIGIRERSLYIRRTGDNQAGRDKTRKSSSGTESDSGKSLADESSSDESKPITDDSRKKPKSSETIKKLKQLDLEKVQHKDDGQATDRKSSQGSSDEWNSVSLDALSSSSSSSSDSMTSNRPSIYLSLMVFTACFLSYGLLPSLLPYTCLPYSQSTFNYTARIPIIVCPLICLLAVLRAARSTKIIVVLFIIALVAGIYQILLAFSSPDPPLKGNWFGPFFTVTTFIVMDAVFNYVLLCCSTKMSEDYGPTGLAWCGSLTQLGCFTGSLVAILIVDVFDGLTRKRLCDDMVRAMSGSSKNLVVYKLNG